MIDVLAIATNGYISLDRKPFSIATDGYYPNNVAGTIVPDNVNFGGGKRSLGDKSLYLQDEEDLIQIFSIFLQRWG